MPGRDELDRCARSILTETFQVPPESITDRASIREDLYLESLDVVELITALHKALGYNAPMEAYRDVDTYGKLLDFLERRVGAA